MMARCAAAVAALCAVLCAGQFTSFTNVYVGTATTYPNAKDDCIRKGGGVAIGQSAGHQSLVWMNNHGQDVWLGGEKLQESAWYWTGGVEYATSEPRLFYFRGECVYGLCAWAKGEPISFRSTLLILTSMIQFASTSLWASRTPDTDRVYECSLPYTVTFQCVFTPNPNEYLAAYRDCASRGGYLGGVPTSLAWTAVKTTPGCSDLPNTRVGCDDFDADAIQTGNLVSSQHGYYHWRGGFLGSERGGNGRLLSSGAYPNTMLYGLPTLSYAPGEPAVRTDDHTIEVTTSDQFNDISAGTDSSGPTAYVCEYPPGFPPPTPSPTAPPTPPPTPPPPTPAPTPPPTTTLPPTTVPPGSCFTTYQVNVTTIVSLSGCRIVSSRITVTGQLTLRNVDLTDSVIVVVGGPTTRSLVITNSTLTNTAILVKGNFTAMSTIRVVDSTVTMTMPVDVEQPSNVAVWMHLKQPLFDQGCVVDVLRNTIVMTMTVPVSVAVVYSSGRLTLTDSALRIDANTVLATTRGPMAALLRSDGEVVLAGTGVLELVGNSASLTASTQAYFVTIPTLTVGAGCVGNLTDNTATLTARSATFYLGALVILGLMEFRHNEVMYGSSVPYFVDSAVSLPAMAARLVLTENVLTSDGTAAVPTQELRGPVTGTGTLAVGCTSFFGVLFLTLADLLGIVPPFTNTVLEPCTSRFVPTPAPPATNATGGVGSSVGGIAAAGGLSTATLLSVVIGSVLGMLALMLVVIIVVTLWRHRGRVSRRGRYAKSTSVVGGSASNTGRRSSRSSHRPAGSTHPPSSANEAQ